MRLLGWPVLAFQELQVLFFGAVIKIQWKSICHMLNAEKESDWRDFIAFLGTTLSCSSFLTHHRAFLSHSQKQNCSSAFQVPLTEMNLYLERQRKVEVKHGAPFFITVKNKLRSDPLEQGSNFCSPTQKKRAGQRKRLAQNQCRCWGGISLLCSHWRMKRREQFTDSCFYSLHKGSNTRGVVVRKNTLNKLLNPPEKISGTVFEEEGSFLCSPSEKSRNSWNLSLWRIPFKPLKIFPQLKLNMSWGVLFHRQGTGLGN